MGTNLKLERLGRHFRSEEGLRASLAAWLSDGAVAWGLSRQDDLFFWVRTRARVCVCV